MQHLGSVVPYGSALYKFVRLVSCSIVRFLGDRKRAKSLFPFVWNDNLAHMFLNLAQVLKSRSSLASTISLMHDMMSHYNFFEIKR